MTRPFVTSLVLATNTRWTFRGGDAVASAAIGLRVGGRSYGGFVQMREEDRVESPTARLEGQAAERKPRVRKRAKGTPTHVRSWPLRPTPNQRRSIQTRFFTGARVYNAVPREFIDRSRAVKSDPAWRTARQLPHRTERTPRSAAFRAVEQSHGFTVEAAQSFASSLRRSWIREHLPAQEIQNLGGRAFDAVKQWHLGNNGKPAASGRRGKEQLVELAEIEGLIAAGKVLSTRIVKTVIDGRDTFRMQMVVDGHPTRRHPIGYGRVSFDLGPATIAVAVQRRDGTWAGWVQPLADRIRLDTASLRRTRRHLDRQHRAGSPGCFNPNGTHKPGCQWKRSAAAQRTAARASELHRRLAGHRKTLHGTLANQLFAHGSDIACEKLDYVWWQKNFPRSVRDREPGMFVETIRRKAASAGGGRMFDYATNTTALSQTCLCGDRKKKPLSQRVHRCECGITEHRDLFSAYLGLHVHKGADGHDRLDLEAVKNGWLHRQDIDGCRGSVAASPNRRGRRYPSSPSRRSVARINARRTARAAKRQSGSARTPTTNRPTAMHT
jgi:putative transposase